MKVRLQYDVLEPIRGRSLLRVFLLAGWHSAFAFYEPRHLRGYLDVEQGPGTVEFSCPELGLQPGIYNLDATIETADSIDPVDRLRHCVTLRVDPGHAVRGLFYTAHQCQVEQGPESVKPSRE